jgi:transcriptional regulator with XRE-family HTH domain
MTETRGTIIARLRRDRGLSQRELAAMSGISGQYLGQIEVGAREGTFDVLADLARALGVSLDAFDIERRDGAA